MNLKTAIANTFDDVLERIRKERWPHCAAIINQWLARDARKKPVQDLADRLKRMQVEVEHMCEVMRLKFEAGTIVVKVDGSAEQTFKKLRLGTNWFEPDTDVMVQILAGLDDKAGS